MRLNFGYYGEVNEDIYDTKKPLLVTAAGNYKIYTQKIRETKRPQGRFDYQLLYIAAGEAEFYFDGVKKIVPRGNMVLIRPRVPQLYYLYAKDKPESYWVHFTGSDVKKLLDYYEIPENESVFYVGTSPDFAHLFSRMIQELQLRRLNFEDMLDMTLRQVFLVINRYLNESKDVGGVMLREIEEAANYFNKNYNQNIIIEDYATENHMTPCWFIQNFKQITRYTPMQYIINLRISNAMNFLDSTTYNISQIAADVGYDNALYFSRLFKKHTGMSPMEYRKRNQTDTKERENVKTKKQE